MQSRSPLTGSARKSLVLGTLILASSAALAGHDDPPPPVSTVTALEDGSFYFESVAEIDAPTGAVWAKIKNIEKVVEIALTGIATDFEWLDGGGPGHVPSEFQFVALGTIAHEEVFYRSHADMVLQYRIVTPALGIQEYVGTMQVEAIDAKTSRLTFSRTIVFDDPAAVDSFADLFEQEIANIQDHFTH